MFGFSEYSEEGRPWFHVGKVAVTSTVLLVGVFTLSMAGVALLLAVQAGGLLAGMPLVARDVWQGQVWRLVTWPLFNIPSLWFALSMLMLFFFGREVERILGRVGLLKFTGWLAVCLVGITVVLPGGSLGGSGLLGFGIFLAFAIMQPGEVLFFGLRAKWVALILIAISALIALASRDVVALAQLAVVCVASAGVLHIMGAAYGLSWLRLPVIRFKRSPFSGARRLADTPSARLTGGGPREFVSPEPEIDRLLDKVAAHGLHSLTDAERRRLADASERYQRRK